MRYINGDLKEHTKKKRNLISSEKKYECVRVTNLYMLRDIQAHVSLLHI